MDWLKSHIWPSVQPVIQETDDHDYPYAIPGGTVFFVVYKGRAFAVSARHVLFPLSPICLFPTDTSQKIIPLEKVFYIPEEKTEDDFSDFGIIEIDVKKSIADSELRLLKAINLENVQGDWQSVAMEARFVVLGYPKEHSKLDFSEKSIVTPQYMLKCDYCGASGFSDSVYTLKVIDHPEISDFNGFSGSPVFACIPNEISPISFLFCGMAIRGTCGAGLIHFVESSVLLSAIQAKPAPYKVRRLMT